MSDLEIAAGWISGVLPPESEEPALERSITPREALEQVLLPSLSSSRCFVEFSGGRDSSLVLAVAARLAARETLPAPVAVTRRYSFEPDTDEREWQELVVRHLGVEDWARVETTPDDADVLGPPARKSLLQHGVLWPPLIHTAAPFQELVRGGTVLTGEGGDEWLGPQRSAVFRHMLNRRGRVSRPVLVHLARTLAPQWFRRRRLLEHLTADDPLPWLQPAAKAAVLESLARDQADQPLRYDRSLARLRRRRTWLMGVWNRSLLAAQREVRYLDPLQEPLFVAALQRAGKWVGWTSRTGLLRALFADLLPDEVLSRETKADFSKAMLNEHSRAFIAEWGGQGIRPDLVSADRLRETWSQESIAPGTNLLLQTAWLASQGKAPDGSSAVPNSPPARHA
jgi:asparagine synthase (glutamine-hydrolysing)